jgi:PAP2 superfamily/Vanadium chloroperoxidase N-terminal domain
MLTGMRRSTIHALTITGTLATAAIAAPTPAAADAVLDWNVTGFEATSTGGQNNAALSRPMAMMHLAVHDALNALERRYEPYVYTADRPYRQNAGGGPADPATAADAAIAAAARDVLVGVIPAWGTPEQQAKALAIVDKAYAATLAKLPDGPAKQHGIAVGQAAAAAMLLVRKSDGSSAAAQYAPGTAPGKWRPHPNPSPANPPIADPALAVGNAPALLPQWAQMTPFTLVTSWQFRLAGPPSLTSAEYARDYDEVKRIGGKDSAARTDEQSQIARFWYEGSAQGWSRIARVLAAERGLDRWDSARLFALVNTAIADGFIAGFDTRYVYDLWRPVTAIRAGDADGNDLTIADPRWETYLNTPPIPEYPSTHSIAGGAAAAVLARFFGSDKTSFRMTSGAPFAGITRSFASFSQAAQENADSRVYAGVHFRSACQDGIRLGQRIGARAFANYLQPYGELTSGISAK